MKRRLRNTRARIPTSTKKPAKLRAGPAQQASQQAHRRPAACCPRQQAVVRYRPANSSGRPKPPGPSPRLRPQPFQNVAAQFLHNLAHFILFHATQRAAQPLEVGIPSSASRYSSSFSPFPAAPASGHAPENREPRCSHLQRPLFACRRQRIIFPRVPTFRFHPLALQKGQRFEPAQQRIHRPLRYDQRRVASQTAQNFQAIQLPAPEGRQNRQLQGAFRSCTSHLSPESSSSISRVFMGAALSAGKVVDTLQYKVSCRQELRKISIMRKPLSLVVLAIFSLAPASPDRKPA